ncbi:hypothetical protein L9F63_000204, partial [Diploptera punctata]
MIVNNLSFWSVVLLATLTMGQPTKSKVSFKLETAMEQMRIECEEGKSDSAVSCLKYRVLNAIDELFKNGSGEKMPRGFHGRNYYDDLLVEGSSPKISELLTVVLRL